MKEVAQLALAVQLPDDETFESFQSESHQGVLNQLQDFIARENADIGQPNSFYLFGIKGVGKSHLLHASCVYATELGKSSLCLSFSEIKQLSVEILDGLEQIDLICLDDIQLIANDSDWQRAVFDLFNRAIEHNKCLIITGDQSAAKLGISLPDLVSRLTWGYTEQVKTLSDDDKIIALQYRAQQRGMALNNDVARYLLNRLSRDMASLISSLDELDKASIREQRKITIPFIKDVLLNN
ncbi:DnaA regulatory inactivator Hda [Colwelliaceae bacterium 6471]